MIYTVTLNPSLDYFLRVKALQDGRVNRSTQERILPGGKGINVSIVLATLGHENRALGFLAGFTGNEVEHLLSSYGCNCDFVTLNQGQTRINVKIQSTDETEINAQGPKITEIELKMLLKKLDCLGAGDYLVLAGSVPSSLPNDIYEQILYQLQGKDIRTVIDATGELLEQTLPYHPFLIKPNHHELGELFHTPVHSQTHALDLAKQLQDKGARNVLVSMASEGAVLLDEQKQMHQYISPNGVVRNSVGAGDSMVAGFLSGFIRTQNYQKALELAVATGSASAFCDWLPTKSEVLCLLDRSADFGLE